MSQSGLVRGKVVIVTGGGSGIGAATAVLCAEEGARAVVIVDLDRQVASTPLAAIKAAGPTGVFRRTDVSDPPDVSAMVDEVVEQFGRIDCAANVAGVSGVRARLCDYTDDEWQHVIDVNLNGVFYCMRAEIRSMLRTGGGAIVNVGSGAHVRPNPGLAAYSATKSGVVSMTAAAAGEHARDGIRLNTVLPGPTRTPMFDGQVGDIDGKLQVLSDNAPLGRLGDATEVAQAIVWMCSDRSTYVHGTTLLVDGATHAYSGPPVPEFPPRPATSAGNGS